MLKARMPLLLQLDLYRPASRAPPHGRRRLGSRGGLVRVRRRLRLSAGVMRLGAAGLGPAPPAKGANPRTIAALSEAMQSCAERLS